MMKYILLNYLMGKYRKYLSIASIVISFIITVRYYFIFRADFYFPSLFLYLLIPMPLIVVLNNTPVFGSPSVNENSSDLDIFLRYCSLLGTLLPFILVIYLTFYPEKYFEY